MRGLLFFLDSPWFEDSRRAVAAYREGAVMGEPDRHGWA